MPKIISNESIFQAVIKVVSEKSYLGASTKLMAERAGISEITLFRKFGTKAGVVVAAIRHMLGDGRMDEMFRYSGDVRSDLSRIVSLYLQMVKKNGQFLFILMSEIPRCDELGEVLEIPLELMSNFSGLIIRYQDEGVLVRESVQESVSSLIGPLMYEGMMYNARNKMGSFQVDGDIYVEKFLTGRLLKP